MEVIREIGAFAGLAAFLGLAVLALLYFAQARDVRRLRENAEFLVDPDAPGAPPGAPAPIGAEGEQDTQAGQPATGAEAFRRTELARQAADRRQRFEKRRTGDGTGRLGELPSTAVIVVGALILIGGIAFGASRLFGGDDGTAAGGAKGDLACRPGQTGVAVLNGTAEPGLAAGSAKQLETKGYNVGPVTNTDSAYDTSTVMFNPADNGEKCAAQVSPIVGVQAQQPMDPEIERIAKGVEVAVVLGEDRATGGGSDATSTDSSTGTLGD